MVKALLGKANISRAGAENAKGTGELSRCLVIIRSMGSFDTSGLIKAGMFVLGIATAAGHFEDVQRWAIMELAKSITTVKPTHFLSRRSARKG